MLGLNYIPSLKLALGLSEEQVWKAKQAWKNTDPKGRPEPDRPGLRLLVRLSQWESGSKAESSIRRCGVRFQIHCGAGDDEVPEPEQAASLGLSRVFLAPGAEDFWLTAARSVLKLVVKSERKSHSHQAKEEEAPGGCCGELPSPATCPPIHPCPSMSIWPSACLPTTMSIHCSSIYSSTTQPRTD